MFHIIDDNGELGELTAEMIKSAGYGACCYNDPVQYLDAVRESGFVAPIAVFTDIRMPKMNGLELIEKLHDILPEQRVVILSGYGSDYESTRNSVCHFLVKPFSPQKLIAIVDAIVRCDKEGSSVANSDCVNLLDESERSNFICPLDCFECGSALAS